MTKSLLVRGQAILFVIGLQLSVGFSSYAFSFGGPASFGGNRPGMTASSQPKVNHFLQSSQKELDSIKEKKETKEKEIEERNDEIDKLNEEIPELETEVKNCKCDSDDSGCKKDCSAKEEKLVQKKADLVKKENEQQQAIDDLKQINKDYIKARKDHAEGLYAHGIIDKKTRDAMFAKIRKDEQDYEKQIKSLQERLDEQKQTRLNREKKSGSTGGSSPPPECPAYIKRLLQEYTVINRQLANAYLSESRRIQLIQRREYILYQLYSYSRELKHCGTELMASGIFSSPYQHQFGQSQELAELRRQMEQIRAQTLQGQQADQHQFRRSQELAELRRQMEQIRAQIIQKQQANQHQIGQSQELVELRRQMEQIRAQIIQKQQAEIVAQNARKAEEEKRQKTIGGVCDRTPQIQQVIGELLEINISEDNCGSGSVTDEKLKQLADVRELKLSNKDIKELTEEDFAGFTNLVELDLSHNSITSLPDGVFLNLRKLRKLNLSNNLLEDVSADVLKGPTELKTLFLSNNFLTDVPDLNFLNKLQKLYLVSNSLSTLPTSLVEIFGNRRQVLHIYINNNRISADDEGKKEVCAAEKIRCH